MEGSMRPAADTMSLRKKTIFTAEQKASLEAAYSDGLVTTGAANSAAIEKLSEELKLDIPVIKNWIGNKRSGSKKRLRLENEGKENSKPPRKVTKPNAYNVFTGEFYQSEEGRSIQSHAEKNKIVAERWRQMSEVEKTPYFERAKEGACGTRGQPEKSWKEASRIIRNLESNACWAEQCQIQVMYIVCHGQNHYCGGTNLGRKYLIQHPRVPEEFLLSVNAEKTAIATSTGRGREEWENLRKAVQSILNLKYAAAVGKPKARVPYSTISPLCIKGFPKGLKFGPPSSFSTESLKLIVDAAEDIAFTGAATLPAHLIEHSYSKPLSDPIKIPPRPKSVNTRKNSTVLSAAGDIKDVYDSLIHQSTTSHAVKEKPKPCSKKVKQPKKPTPGSSVHVVHEGKRVAKAVIMDGTLLHGSQIPSEYVKLSIKEMLDDSLNVPLQFKGPFDSDDDLLMSGVITAWRLDSLYL